MSQNSGQADNHKNSADVIPSSLWGKDVRIDAELIKANLSDIKNKIAPCKPRIIGVTKYFGLSSIINGYEAGLRDFGESRAIDGIEKIKLLPEDVRQKSQFHFIGHLQTNKADKVVEYFDYLHSADSLKLVKIISEAALKNGKKEKIFLQVNNSGEEQKTGYTREGLTEEMPEIIKLDGIEIVGLMNMAPLGADECTLHRLFGELRDFRDSLNDRFGLSMRELSMGMSDDYEIAVKEGATMIRIGRKLFT